jgi:predicted lipid-binding transport protein (Tim44 family)
MKTWLIGALAVAVFTTSLPFHAEAKRLGGSKSSGMQRNMPERTAPTAPPAKPATPAQGQQAAPTNAAAATPGAAAAAAPAKRSWMGPIAGLAAGLGLAALMSHLGMGEAFANFLMLALLAVAVVALGVFLMRRFGNKAGNNARMGSPALAGAGAGAGGSSRGAWEVQQPAPVNAAPMERSNLAEPSLPAAGAAPVAAAAAVAAPVAAAFVPAAFDAEGFARTAKMIFIRLQAANDSADLEDLKRFTTPELFASLRMDLLERGNTGQHTDVQQVEAEVLDVANEADRQIVSVRFHGLILEETGAAPVAFNEVWHLVKPHDDSRSWAIAGIEQLN